jgi:hypothetical protein
MTETAPIPKAVAALIDKIDGNGLVGLVGFAGQVDPKIRYNRFAIAEMAAYAPDASAKKFIEENVLYATDVWQRCRMYGFGVAAIPYTLAIPNQTVEILGKSFDLGTVAGVLGFINAPHTIGEPHAVPAETTSR